MSRNLDPLVLMLAIAVPAAAAPMTADALGLGDIHVDSALNERLSAEIEIIGATPDELDGLRAAVANRETFLLYGVERHAFLSSTTFKVGRNSQGHPILSIRSGDSYTEPVVNLLVDLHWPKGELVREYTLLLDPPNFGDNVRLAEAAPAPPLPAPRNDTSRAAPCRKPIPRSRRWRMTVKHARAVTPSAPWTRSAASLSAWARTRRTICAAR